MPKDRMPKIYFGKKVIEALSQEVVPAKEIKRELIYVFRRVV
jgi:hypothetical protein